MKTATIRQSSKSERQEKLDQASEILKKQFIGLDAVIDDIIAAISGWYHYPEYQSSPCIVNLWGLTGTGKSAVVRKLIKLLDIEDVLLHFDMGENPDISSETEEAKLLTKAPVIVIDEIQHARTISENGFSINGKSGDIWQLLDTGTFHLNADRSEAHNLMSYVNHLENILPNICVEDGWVTHGKELFINEVDQSDWVEHNEYEEDKPAPFISKRWDGYIRDRFPQHFITKYELRCHLMQLSPEATIAFCRDAVKEGLKPQTLNVSQALIFICGNIDEAYTMGGEIDAENDPDIFYQQAKKVSMSDIKRALLKRFRFEQIARLGNIHIPFPAFGRQQYFDIIDQELEAVRNRMWFDTETRFSFHDSLRNYLYEEGVFPAQGARPLLSTIRYVVHANIARWMLEKERLAMDPLEIEIGYENEHLFASYLHYTIEFQRMRTPVNSRVKRLRRCEDSEKQAIVAVHESGHAICLTLLLGTLPNMVFSKKSSASNGSVLAYFKDSLTTRSNLVNKLAVFLAGHVAETLIYGKEKVSHGSSSDIDKATQLALDMARNNGLGQHLIKIDDHRFHPLIRDPQHQSDELAKQWLQEAQILAEKTLKQQKALLLEMSRYLFTQPMMEKDAIESMIRTHAVGVDLEKVLSESRYYRKRLGV
jgi:hypothetical protein